MHTGSSYSTQQVLTLSRSLVLLYFQGLENESDLAIVVDHGHVNQIFRAGKKGNKELILLIM